MLEQILAHKRAEVAERKSRVSLEALLARCEPSPRSLSAALRRGRPGFLLEIKFTSPSGGTIRSGADLAPVFRSYGAHADAVSVLTDGRFFGGSLERLAQARRHLEQPLLCKDFILEPYQVAEARAHGADAILLILAALSDSDFAACAALAARLGLEVLTEVHDRSEALRAVGLGAPLIGVNNRDLRTLEMDPSTVERVAPAIPEDRLIVAESGIATRDEVARLRRHADAFLIGTALMREPDLDRAVRAMVYGRTKICGLTRPADARAARDAGATHGGLVFAAGSPRTLPAGQARVVRGSADLAWVGVFADEDPAVIARAARELELSAVQLHGGETLETVAQLRGLVPEGCELWKAVQVARSAPPRGRTGADRLVLDAGRGSGRSFDWAVLPGYAERSEVVLAGGLRPENVARAAGFLTYALDASSGLESAPGRKDPATLRRFFAERRRLPGRGDQAR